MLRVTDCLCADRLGLRPIAARTLNVFRCPHSSDSAFRFFICSRSRGSKLLCPVLDGVAIRNCSVSPNVEMSSEYLLRWYHSLYFLKTSVRRTHGVQPIADPSLLHGVPS
jgi:hypothetical protein